MLAEDGRISITDLAKREMGLSKSPTQARLRSVLEAERGDHRLDTGRCFDPIQIGSWIT